MSYYQDLDIWKKSIIIIKILYDYTSRFPKTETFSLVDQMRRSAVSVASNIAEGSGWGSSANNVRFLQIANGSCTELQAQIIISPELGFLPDIEFENLQNEVSHLLNMISWFIKKKKEYQ